jgi:O-antigen/teichoic acid export membrane protein
VGAVRAALFGGIALALTSLLSAAVQSIGRPGVRFRSYLVAAVVGLALLIPLVRTWGATGGAVAIYLIVPAVDLVILIAVVRARLQRAVVNLVVVTTATLAWSLALGRGVDSFMRLALAGIVSGVLACILMMLTDGRALVRSISFVRNRTPPS